jgi:hypothetical protein
MVAAKELMMTTKLSLSLATLIVTALPAVASAQAAPSVSFVERAALTALNTEPARKAIDSREIERQFERTAPSPAFVGLYTSLGALNVLDVVTTRKALAQGATEMNPLMQGTVKNSYKMTGVKLASTAVSILFMEKMRKKNPKLAFVSGLVANGIAAAVVVHNTRQLR